MKFTLFRPLTRSARVLLLFVAGLPELLFSQASVLGKNCDLAILGATDAKTFVAFDHEFRYAMTNRDAGILALLVKPSLRVNDDRGTYYVEDARSLQLRFQQIFTPAVRHAVLDERAEALSCTSSGVMYGDGVVWVESTPSGYAVGTVNVPAGDQAFKSPERTIEFVCNAEKHRAIVDSIGEGAPRYRAWTKPHSISEKPDLEISEGKREFQGSGVCAYTDWIFASGGAIFQLQGPGGCYEDSKQPPADARGSLDVSLPGKPDVSWWCR